MHLSVGLSGLWDDPWRAEIVREELMMTSWPPHSDPRVELVARRLCEADGHEPDVIVTDQIMPLGPRGSTVLPGPEHELPAWRLYAGMALAMVQLIDSGKFPPPQE